MGHRKLVEQNHEVSDGQCCCTVQILLQNRVITGLKVTSSSLALVCVYLHVWVGFQSLFITCNEKQRQTALYETNSLISKVEPANCLEPFSKSNLQMSHSSHFIAPSVTVLSPRQAPFSTSLFAKLSRWAVVCLCYFSLTQQFMVCSSQHTLMLSSSLSFTCAKASKPPSYELSFRKQLFELNLFTSSSTLLTPKNWLTVGKELKNISSENVQTQTLPELKLS